MPTFGRLAMDVQALHQLLIQNIQDRMLSILQHLTGKICAKTHIQQKIAHCQEANNQDTRKTSKLEVE